MKQQQVAIVLLCSLAVGLVCGRPADDAKKIFKYMNKEKKSTIPVPVVKEFIAKLLPTSDLTTLDADGDGNVNLAEFQNFYKKQYHEWKKSNFH